MAHARAAELRSSSPLIDGKLHVGPTMVLDGSVDPGPVVRR